MRRALAGLVILSCLQTVPGSSQAVQEETAQIRQKLQSLEASQVKVLQELNAVKVQLTEIRRILESSARPVARPPAPIPVQPVPLTGAPTKGNQKAEVAIIEYSDFQCPYCGQFVRQIQPLIEKEYVSTGKVLLAFRHSPLTTIHSQALKAAEAAECAFRQGKFWEMHDSLFSDQRNLDDPSLLRRAQTIGLDTQSFETCFQGIGTVRVRQDLSAARLLQIASTPTFLIGVVQGDGSVKVVSRQSGAKPFAEFQKVIEPLLARATR